MCVSFKLNIENKTMKEIIDAAQKNAHDVQIKPGDIYPKALAPIFSVSDRKLIVRPMMWGFPLKGKKSVNFNARAETMNRIPMFKRAKPAIIPTSGFYEWQTTNEKKRKLLFEDPDGSITYIAGLFSDFAWLDDGLYPLRFTMLTAPPSPSFLEIHNREPAVLNRDDAKAWLESRNAALVLQPPMELESMPLKAG